MLADERAQYLQPTWFIDADHPAVVAYARETVDGVSDPKQQAIRLFYRVRDGIRYNPYVMEPGREKLRASAAVGCGESFCVPKAILLAACGRVLGVPTRLGFADVINHLSSQQFLDVLKTDVFAFHGYTELYLDDRWVKATPAFNAGLCARFGVDPLEFDGEHDAILHPHDREGQRFMEYIHDHGQFADFPFDLMLQTFRTHYPHLFDDRGNFQAFAKLTGRDLAAEAAPELGAG